MITWCTRVISCYFEGQSMVVASHRVLHSLHQSSPCWLPKHLHLKNGGKKEEEEEEEEERRGYFCCPREQLDMTVAMLYVLSEIPLGAYQKNTFSGNELDCVLPSLWLKSNDS